MKKVRLVFVGLATVLIAISAPRAIAWQLDGVPICTASEDQQWPMIVRDDAGGAIIVWQDWRGAWDTDIYAQRVDSDGSIHAGWPTDGVAVCQANDTQMNAVVIGDGTGGAIIAWDDFRNGTDRDIYAQRINANGARSWAEDGVVICSAQGDQKIPTIITDDVGGAIVAWTDWRANEPDIYAQRVNSSGVTQWATNGIPACTASGWQTTEQFYSTIVRDSFNGAIITWEDRRGTDSDIYAQRVNGSGIVQWTANGVAICAAPRDQDDPRIVEDGTGGAIIAWKDWRPGVGNSDIYAQRVDSGGKVRWTSNGILVCAANGIQGGVAMATDGSQGAVICWGDGRNESVTFSDIYAQRVDSTGAVKWTNNGIPVCTVAKAQHGSDIASDGEGGAIITWEDERGALTDIYAKHVNSAGDSLWDAVVCDGARTGGSAEAHRIVSDDNGGAIIAWYDRRNVSVTGYDIYAQSTAFVVGVEEKQDARSKPYGPYGKLEPRLFQNCPNPFTQSTAISYSIGSYGQLPSSAVSLKIYSISGRLVKTFDLTNNSTGSDGQSPFNQVVWDGRDTNGNKVTSGIYFYRIAIEPHSGQVGEYSEIKKMILLR